MIIALLFFLILTLGLGLPLVLLVCPRANQFIKIGLSFPIGVGFFTLLMFGSNLLGLRFSLPNESLLLLVFTLPMVFLKRKNLKDFFISIFMGSKITGLIPVEKVILAVILFLVVSSFINTFYWPVYMWDSVTLYDYRGHVFAATGQLKDALTNEYYYSYPLLTSLAHAIVYISGGKYPEFIYSLFYLSFGVSFFGILREFVPRKVSLFFTMLLMIIDPIFQHSLYSYVNLTHTVYLGIGAILLYLWNTKKEIGYLILSAFLIGLSLHVRSAEPFWIALLLIVIIFSVYAKKFWSVLIYALIVLPLRQIWIYYQAFISNNMVVSIEDKISLNQVLIEIFNINRWGEVIIYLYKHVVIIAWPLFAVFFLLAATSVWSRKGRLTLILFIILSFAGVLAFGTLIFSIYLDYWSRIGSATERLSMVFYPLLVFYISLAMSSAFKSK